MVYDVEMPHMLSIRRDRGHSEAGHVREFVGVAFCDRLPTSIPVVEVLQFDAQYRSLDLVEP
ncbi:hypothetical protein A5626_07800 [Mycobacterium marseillense]|nr:hypothetical protein A5626_07800 [Mycobacterium marseillense]